MNRKTGLALGIAALAGGSALLGLGLNKKPLIGDDFGAIRREALTRYPIGSSATEAVADLVRIGYRCAPSKHEFENLTEPMATCDSNGRGWPDFSALELCVIARNGSVTDIAVSNGSDGIRAGAATPDPNPGGIVAAPPPPRTATVDAFFAALAWPGTEPEKAEHGPKPNRPAAPF